MRNCWSIRFASAFFCAACAISSQPVAAEPTTATSTGNRVGDAQAHFDQAEKLAQEGKYEQACPLYELSQEEDPAAVTLFQLGDCYEHVGRLASAWKSFEEAAHLAKGAARRATDPDLKGRAQAHAEKSSSRADALKPRLPKLTVVVAGSADLSDLVITIDGAPLDRRAWGQPSPIDAGEHKITAAAPGKVAWSTSIRIGAAKEGTSPDAQTVKVPVLEALPMPAQRKGALVMGGVGAAGLLIGAAFGGATVVQWESVKGRCGDDLKLCSKGTKNYLINSTELESQKNTARMFGDVSTAGFIIGGAAAAAAGILWFTASPSGPSAAPIEVAPAAGPTGASLTVRARF
jgi:hypothetical protein